ncbi:hypothetical protein ACYZT8_11215 [Pseudomonas sp. LB3P93]
MERHFLLFWNSKREKTPSNNLPKKAKQWTKEKAYRFSFFGCIYHDRDFTEMNTIHAYVTKSDGDFVRVKILEAKTKEKLIDIGFANDIDLNEYKINTPTDKKKPKYLIN